MFWLGYTHVVLATVKNFWIASRYTGNVILPSPYVMDTSLSVCGQLGS